MLPAMLTKRQQPHAAAAELIRDHMAPCLRAQRAKEQRLLDVLVANSSPPPQARQRWQLSISDKALIVDVMAAFPTLTREEAIKDLLSVGSSRRWRALSLHADATSTGCKIAPTCAYVSTSRSLDAALAELLGRGARMMLCHGGQDIERLDHAHAIIHGRWCFRSGLRQYSRC